MMLRMQRSVQFWTMEAGMNTQRKIAYGFATMAMTLVALQPLVATAQVPVDEDGKVIGAYEPALAAAVDTPNVGTSDVPLMSAAELEELVGPVALYPDDLLAIILPAAAYPQQIVEAAEFLTALENDASLKPNSDWDDSVIALLNYPEVVELMSADLDWTWRLGEATIAQQTDVVAAIESFRDRAYNAGNLKSDEYQKVSRDDGYIEITPVEEDVIYVPYYEPERVVVYQPRPVYYYYPRSYPVYYYPYTSAYHFNSGFFWGVTTAFSIGWYTDSLHVHHHSYHGHPYYGRHYRDYWWYRRPTMHSYHSNYIGHSTVTVNNYYNGDRWRPRHDRRDYVRHDVRTANNRYTERRRTERQANERRRTAEQTARTQTVRRQDPIAFRERQSNGRSQTQTQRSDRRGSSQEQRTDSATRQNREYVAQQRDGRRDTSRQTGSQRQYTSRQTGNQRQDTSRQTGSQRQDTSRQTGNQRQSSSRQTGSQRQQADTRYREPQQRRQSTATPPQKRQQRTAPPPQRAQRSAPPAQRSAPPAQRSAPQQRQQRSAPPPKSAQRSAPPPQRSESRSSNSRSGSRSSGRRERR
jgi:hypothetical protein